MVMENELMIDFGALNLTKFTSGSGRKYTHENVGSKPFTKGTHIIVNINLTESTFPSRTFV